MKLSYAQMEVSPQPQIFPPNTSNTKPDDNIDHTADKSITPPLGQWDVIRTIEDRS
jgi:hypothetical protein